MTLLIKLGLVILFWTTEAGDMNYTFAPVESPKVTGYGADRGIVEAKIVSGSSDNITEEVLYYANQTELASNTLMT